MKAADLRTYKEKMVREFLHLLRTRGMFQCMCCAQKWIPMAEAAWPNPVRIWEPRRSWKVAEEGIPVYVLCKKCDDALSPKQEWEAVGDHLRKLGKVVHSGMLPPDFRKNLGLKPLN